MEYFALVEKINSWFSNYAMILAFIEDKHCGQWIPKRWNLIHFSLSLTVHRLWMSTPFVERRNVCMIKLYFPLSIRSQHTKYFHPSMRRSRKTWREEEIYGLLKFCVKFNDPFPIYIRTLATRTRAIVIACGHSNGDACLELDIQICIYGRSLSVPVLCYCCCPAAIIQEGQYGALKIDE